MREKILVAGYTRVSTTEQAQNGLGLDIQQKQIEKYCQLQKYNLVKIYKDEGISGATLERQGLKELLKDGKQNKFQKVILSRLDRVARDLYYSLWIEKELLKNDIELFSVAEPYSRDDFMLDGLRKIVMVFAEIEKKMITSRLKNGRHEKAKNGGWTGGICFGYDSKNKKLVINEEEAKIVKKIFYWKRHKKLNYSQIAVRLNLFKIRTKYGKNWFPYTIEKIIKNPIYRGKIRFLGKKYQGIHQKII